MACDDACRLTAYPHAVDLDGAPAGREDDWPAGPAAGIASISADPGQAEQATLEETTEVGEERPGAPLVWKNREVVLQGLQEALAREPPKATLKQLER